MNEANQTAGRCLHVSIWLHEDNPPPTELTLCSGCKENINILFEAVSAAVNAPAWRALYQQLTAPLAELMTGPLASLAAEMARARGLIAEVRRGAGAEREANSQAVQLLAHTQRNKGNGH